jgi:hypothetical protein
MLVNSNINIKPTIHSEHCGEEIIHLGAYTYVPPVIVNFHTYVVSKSHVARPDLISKIIYGDDRYGDLICKLNGISNPFELNEGMIIALPPAADIVRFLVRDSFDDVAETKTDSNKPKPKAKKDKRKPNEAIIGDTRFKIDKERKLIIY